METADARKKTTYPVLSPHRPSGQAVVTLSGRDFYLGVYGTEESRAKYDRLVAEWLANARHLPVGGDSLTINELILTYWRFAERYYRKNGKPTGELSKIRSAMRPVKRLYGGTEVAQCGPLAMKVVREALIDSGNCRATISASVERIERMLKWAVANELAPPKSITACKRSRD